ncbi:F-box/LRR-repeat protein 2 [Hondaea fermentalgiana]|uniref:F-box/LRR-repeat protein 2 n=1 Tax=Hondaea fermentalgiana TaxID=2315210 RepID=A0A2R5GJP2_9STRA|nr:F-box/LRR-repeat protein 2 [Hondaea fermentalgiana]|eukprot:GBG31100.1 F-box/LRR-repeat protein 2 [Hondaea fermentalgiana]
MTGPAGPAGPAPVRRTSHASVGAEPKSKGKRFWEIVQKKLLRPPDETTGSAIEDAKNQISRYNDKAKTLLKEEKRTFAFPAGETDKKKKSQFLTHDHVTAIEEGRFIYDPDLVQAVVDVGQRLANLDHYISNGADHDLDSVNPQANQVRYIDTRMMEVLLSDIEDFLQIISRMMIKMEFLREYHTSSHFEIMRLAHKRKNPKPKQGSMSWRASIFWRQLKFLFESFAWFVGMTFFPSRFVSSIEATSARSDDVPVPDTYALPHSFEKRRRLRTYGAIFDMILETTNIATDIIFVVTQLAPLIGTTAESLFHVSIAALAITFILRLGIGLSDYTLVDWNDRRRVQKYLFGVLIAIIEPNTGFNDLVKGSYKINETLGQNSIGQSAGSSVKDPIATQAKADFEAARMSILTAAVLLIQDIPQIAVEVIFIFIFQGGNFELLYWLALVTSLVSASRQFIEAILLLRDIPSLRNIELVRHLVFDPRNDKETAVVDALESLDDLRNDRRRDSDAPGNYDDGFDQEGDLETGLRTDDKGFQSAFSEAADQPTSSIGSTLAAEALTDFFDYDRTTSQSWYMRYSLSALNWVIKILLAPLTLGLSLLWYSPNKYSYGAFRHFLKKLSGSIVFEGKPFHVVQRKLEAKEDQPPPSKLVDVVKGCFRRNRTTRSVPSSSADVSGGIFSLAFSRLDSRILFKSIRSLELMDCVTVDDTILELISVKCPNLQILNLSFCVQITDEGLKAFEDVRCITLHSVVLDGCVKIGDDGVYHIARCASNNLRRLSLRNLPLLTENVLDRISDRCRNLRSLNLSVDVLCREKYKEIQGKGSFLSITKSEPLVNLMKRCGASLRSLHLDNVLTNAFEPMEEWEKFAMQVSRYMRSLSLLGLSFLKHEHLQMLTNWTVNLRELRLASAEKLTSAACLVNKCHALRIVGLCGTQVSISEADMFFANPQMPDVVVVQIDHPRQLVGFYVRQLGVQLGGYQQKPRALSHAMCWGLPCTTHVSLHDLQQGASPSLCLPRRGKFDIEKVHRLCEELDKIDRVIDDIAGLQEKLEHEPDWRSLEYNSPTSMVVLSSIVDLVDYVRRARIRKTLNFEELSTWWDLIHGRESEWGLELIDYVNRIVVDPTSAMPFDKPLESPFVSLRSFGIASTRQLNLNLNFDENLYEFICPDVFASVYHNGPVKTTKLTGKMSPLSPVTLRNTDHRVKPFVERYWYIPDSARYYCWAYPLDGLNADALNWLENQRYEDAARRFLHFGGYLYFDANLRFVAASALTIGNAFSFNGPFKFPKEAMDQLQNADRWREVTIKNLESGNDRKVEFCYIFQGEKVIPEHIRKKHCPHGCFAYRFTSQKVAVTGYLYCLSAVSDIFLPEDADESRGPLLSFHGHDDSNDESYEAHSRPGR